MKLILPGQHFNTPNGKHGVLMTIEELLDLPNDAVVMDLQGDLVRVSDEMIKRFIQTASAPYSRITFADALTDDSVDWDESKEAPTTPEDAPLTLKEERQYWAFVALVLSGLLWWGLYQAFKCGGR